MQAQSQYRALLLCTLAVAACGDAASPVEPASQARGGGSRPAPVPTGTGIGTLSDSTVPRTSQRVEYHGGAVLFGAPRVYLIWYGGWENLDEPGSVEQILVDFLLGLSASPYFRIHTLYPDGAGERPNGGLSWGNNTRDAYSRGSALSEADVGSIVSNAILSGRMRQDPNGIYVVLGSADVSVGPGLGTSYCAVHPKRVNVAGVEVAHAFIGSPERNPSQCAAQLSGPNGGWIGDAMVSILATVLSNAITDPDHDGWYDRLGLEPGDKCAWNFGPVYQTPNGALANVRLGNRDYLLPKLWVPARARSGGYCALAAP